MSRRERREYFKECNTDNTVLMSVLPRIWGIYSLKLSFRKHCKIQKNILDFSAVAWYRLQLNKKWIFNRRKFTLVYIRCLFTNCIHFQLMIAKFQELAPPQSSSPDLNPTHCSLSLVIQTRRRHYGINSLGNSSTNERGFIRSWDINWNDTLQQKVCHWLH